MRIAVLSCFRVEHDKYVLRLSSLYTFPSPGASAGYIAVQSPYLMLVWMMVRFQSALWIT